MFNRKKLAKARLAAKMLSEENFRLKKDAIRLNEDLENMGAMFEGYKREAGVYNARCVELHREIELINAHYNETGLLPEPDAVWVVW